MKRITILFALFVFSALVLSCSREEKEIIFDNSEPLALAPDVEWAVVIDPYVAFRTETTWDSPTNGHCRKSDILQVKGKTLIDGAETWYEFESGWVHSSALAIYSNRYRAVTAASKL